MSRPHVIISEHLDEACAAWLDERTEVTWARHDQPGFASELASAQGLVVRTYTQVNRDLLDQAPNLKVVGRAGVGLDNIDLEACRQRGVAVVFTPDANTQAVVEYALGLMLDRFRPRSAYMPSDGADVFHTMRKTHVGRQLSDLTVGVVGFGRIGKRLTRALLGLGMGRVLVNDLLPESELRDGFERMNPPPGWGMQVEFVDKPGLYGKSDIITLHMDGRPENRDIFGAEACGHLKPGAMVINAARGMLINHDALADWLQRDPTAYAALDVHDPEPPTEANPVAGLPNARLLPHLASRTDTAMRNMSWVVRDVAAVLDGQDPTYPAW